MTSVPVIWPNAQDLPVLVTNTVVSQLSSGPDGRPEECIVTLGHAPPPLILGPAEEQEVALGALEAVSVHAHVRVSLNRARLQELIEVLSRAAAQWDQSQGEQGGHPA